MAPVAVAFVAFANFREDMVETLRPSGLDQLGMTAPRPFLGRGSDEQFHIRVGQTTVPISRPSRMAPPGVAAMAR